MAMEFQDYILIEMNIKTHYAKIMEKLEWQVYVIAQENI